SRRRHTRFDCDWSSDVCSSDLVDGEFYRRHGARERQLARKRLGIPASTRLLVQVSALEPWKGVRELLTAFVSLRSELATGAMLRSEERRVGNVCSCRES